MHIARALEMDPPPPRTTVGREQGGSLIESFLKRVCLSFATGAPWRELKKLLRSPQRVRPLLPVRVLNGHPSM